MKDEDRTKDQRPRTVAGLEPGDHLCCLYKTEEEHRSVLTPFLRQGLERGEKVLYIVDAHTAETVLGYLRDDGLEVEPYLASGQLSILTVDDAYIREGVFDPEGMIALLRAETERALAEGYSALRVTGEMTWALRGLPGSERLIENEAKLNEFFPGSKCLAICQYDRRRFDPEVLLDVLSTHPLAVIGTEVYDNFYYIPPAEFLGRDRPVVELSHWVQNLAERKRAEIERERFRAILDRAAVAVYVSDAEDMGRFVDCNETAYRQLGYSRAELLTMRAKDLEVDFPMHTPEQWRAHLADMKATDRALFIESVHQRKDGTTFPVEVAVSYMPFAGRDYTLAIVRDITERKRAEEEIRRRNEELATLNAIAMTVTSTLDLQEVLRAIQEKVMKLLDEKYPPLFALFDEGDQTFEAVLTHLQEEPLRRVEKLLGMKFGELVLPLSTLNSAVREALLAGKPYVTSDGSDILGPRVSRGLIRSAQRALGVKWIVDLPLWVKGKLVGSMALFSQKEKMPDEEMELLSSIASQAAIAIENARLYEEAQARSTYLETMLQINATLRSTLPLNRVLETIVQGTAEALGYVGSFITVPDATGERLTLGAAWGGRIVDAFLRVARIKLESFGVPVKAQENLIARAFVTGELQVSSGEPEALAVGAEPTISAKMARATERIAGARLAACVPLRVAEKTVGVLIIVSPREQLTDEERTMLLGLADQAGLAIQNARLYEETQRHLEQVTALREIDKAISSTLDLPEVLVIILEQLERLVPYHSAAVYLLTDDTAKVTAASGVPDLDRAMQVSFQVSEDALARQLLEERRPLVLADAQTDERFQARGEAEYVRSWIGVPLIVREEMIGFLTIDHREPGVYDEESGEMALSFANQVAIAIENARAYERLKTQNLETISALAAAVEAKDPYTSGHSEKVTQFAIAIAGKMGLSNNEIEDLRVAALLHDIGKIGIPDSVLNKPARLTSAEFLMVKAHPFIAAEIVGKIEALAHLVPIIRHHHERHDGQGYPDGLKGKKIPLLARILAVADGFEAMTSERPYRRAFTEEEAMAELQKGADSQWDPNVVEAFVKICESGIIS